MQKCQHIKTKFNFQTKFVYVTSTKCRKRDQREQQELKKLFFIFIYNATHVLPSFDIADRDFALYAGFFSSSLNACCKLHHEHRKKIATQTIFMLCSDLIIYYYAQMILCYELLSLSNSFFYANFFLYVISRHFANKQIDDEK